MRRIATQIHKLQKSSEIFVSWFDQLAMHRQCTQLCSRRDLLDASLLHPHPQKTPHLHLHHHDFHGHSHLLQVTFQSWVWRHHSVLQLLHPFLLQEQLHVLECQCYKRQTMIRRLDPLIGVNILIMIITITLRLVTVKLILLVLFQASRGGSQLPIVLRSILQDWTEASMQIQFKYIWGCRSACW